MAYPTFRQLATILGGRYSASSMAMQEGVKWPPPPTISLRTLLSFRPGRVPSVLPSPEPGEPRTTIGAGYYDIPAQLLPDPWKPPPTRCKTPPTLDGLLAGELQAAADLRDGNKILRRAGGHMAENLVSPGSFSPELITAVTQLAVTGSNAFAAWLANPTQDLTSYLVAQPPDGEGMPPDAAAAANRQIMSDFNAARTAVRNPSAGMRESSLREGFKNKWIGVCGDHDPPDYPVNVEIAQYPQYHLPITVPTPQGPNPSIDLKIRFIVASQNPNPVTEKAYIPPGDEVIIYIHGEGSRAEEAGDFIPALFAVGAAAGRSFTVISFDQPSCGYSTMVPHLGVAPMPPTSGGAIDTSAFAGTPILDFIENTIITFVETLVIPNGNPITAVIGGSLGGHMALRFAASNIDWVRNVIAWSPASVWDYNVSLLGVSIPHRTLSNPVLAGHATSTESESGGRLGFFETVYCMDTFNPNDYAGDYIAAIATALLAAGIFSVVLVVAVGVIIAAIMALPVVPPQPQMWFRDDWASKDTYIEESRRDRREVYNTNYRQWHWRISEELIGFSFDGYAPEINKPLLLMVGENDDYPQVHFVSNVTNFAAGLTGPAQGAVSVQDTGHSIHNERPYFLAHQVVNFARPL